MSDFKIGDVCEITNRIWGGAWSRGTPEYIGCRVCISEVWQDYELESGEIETVYRVKFIGNDWSFSNGGLTYSPVGQKFTSTIQHSALKLVPRNSFGKWLKQIEDRNVVGHGA